ncbi:heavy metal translocating P-type ATPase [Agitococcus lubricus]|uniref:Cu2+-exporting ATPase n=1 Tax=Agitococcus lubricus TaxID=1077255 RepID=A0A2T5IX58_9GAMM|nr:heavy metal translocating P-type ATPase [Agitococcus lubricus]PTQ88499.1 Cu2+-exporting ATPase [Agitococcus lubricus]
MTACFHCGEVVPPDTQFSLQILGETRHLCCMGCFAVAETIVSAGLESYYLERDTISPTAALPEALERLKGYDHPDTQRQFIHREQELACAEISLEGVTCAACAWLIEKRLQQEPAVKQASVNLSSHRLRLLWNDTHTPLSELLNDLEKLGYKARPFRHDTHAALLKKESRQLLMRLGVAGLGSMQSMMYAGSLYVATDMTVEYRDFFRWVSLLVTLPVFFYSGYPLYRAAWFALKARSLTMDVSVSLAIILSFIASIYATIVGAPHVYYDSVTMFIFFLLTGRFLETQARRQASETANDLIPITPRLSHRLLNSGDYEDVPISEIRVHDRLLVKAGETIPCDGVIVAGHSAVSEALLTGEPLPLSKSIGDSVVSGSQNHDSPLQIDVTQTASASTLATIHQLMARALAEKPLLAQKADRFAHWFIVVILLLSGLVYGLWSLVDRDYALLATIAVLVATCPCALSLATPVALTAATHRLARLGFLATRGHVLDSLSATTHIVFDKTGTLTEGKLELINTVIVAGDTSQALNIAYSLEQYSEHPVAHAFKQLKMAQSLPLDNLENTAGAGIAGDYKGLRYRIGHAHFSLGNASSDAPEEGVLRVYLSANYQLLAYFDFSDKIRSEAETTIQQLHRLGLSTILLSGDHSRAPQQLAQQLAMTEVHGSLSPQDKAAYVQKLQANGAVVTMIGDGINDAPVLNQAHLSIAMSSGADLAQLSADAILLGDRLTAVVAAYRSAQRTQTIIKQNLVWAFVYNLAVLPPAALGWIPPWLAAIGMSLSSLLVVLNALRLKRN